MDRLTKVEFPSLKACDKCIELDECHQKQCVQVYDALLRLKHYEDLEAQLREVYGECDGLLEESVKCLVEHEKMDIGKPVKARLLTDGSVDMWEEYKKIGTVEECRLYKGISEKDLSASGLDLKVIKELREYRKIGTIEECQEARERQKKLEIEEFGICPLCYYDFGYEKANYCPNCGHALVLGGEGISRLIADENTHM